MESYIDILSEVVFVLSLGVEGVSGLGANPPLWSLVVGEFICYIIVGTLGCLFAYMMG